MGQETLIKVKGYFTVLNEKGLHTRPSTELVRCTSGFKAQITLIYQGLTVNAKSLLGILMLAAGKGAKIEVEAEGPDAEEALSALIALSEQKFKIQY